MKKEYSRALKKIFTEKLKREISGVKLWTKKSEYIFPGEVVYSLGKYNGTSVFIVLIPNQKDDSFNVEMLWSKKEGFPKLSVRPNAMFTEPELADEYAIRLSCIIDGVDKFWVIPKKELSDPLEEIIANMKKPTEDEAIIKLTPLIDDCVQKVLDFGIPFLEKVLKG